VSDQSPTRATLAVLAVVAAFAASCAGETNHATSTGGHMTTSSARTSTVADDGLQLSNTPQDCLSAAQRTRVVGRALREAAALRRMAAPLERSQMGTPKLQRATGRFLTHLGTSKLDNYYQNRLIDKAASAVAFACEQCFQMLEASRPIPAMQYGPHTRSCG
jgi:hypothetical protein